VKRIVKVAWTWEEAFLAVTASTLVISLLLTSSGLVLGDIPALNRVLVSLLVSLDAGLLAIGFCWLRG
jgi:hypothetical protein